MEGRLLLDVVVGECATVFQLLAGEDQALLIGWDSFLVLDLGLHVLNRVAWLDFEGDGLAGEGLDEDLHATTETEHQGGELIPSGCCSPTMCDHLRVVYRRRSDVADRVGFPPCLGF